ncbi:MAG: VanZ family protein [Balneolaceae bacterium]|nr:VanZ family protein [Balneolaceae bacterium]MBO6546011.1 VanZ family protein [Balneolaceae bacterium]MBO6647407.1 VanZ family protein [Balneolaceae bacterium]
MIKTLLFKYRKLTVLLFVLVTIVILVGTLFPANSLSNINIWSYDKVAHLFAFAAWTFLFGVVRALWKQTKPNLFNVFALGLFYGLLIELFQFILPTNRSPELYDFIADALGSGLAVLLLKPIFKRMFEE